MKPLSYTSHRGIVRSLTLSQWSSSGNPVAIQCAWNLDPSVHWNATGQMPVCFQWSSSGFPVVFQCVPIMQINTGLPLGHHWVQASASVVQVASQCTCGSSGLPIMQINTGSPLEHHWVLASASVVPVASQCTCGSSGLPVRSVQWYPSVLTESGLEVIGSLGQVTSQHATPNVYNCYGESCLS